MHTIFPKSPTSLLLVRSSMVVTLLVITITLLLSVIVPVSGSGAVCLNGACIQQSLVAVVHAYERRLVVVMLLSSLCMLSANVAILMGKVPSSFMAIIRIIAVTTAMAMLTRTSVDTFRQAQGIEIWWLILSIPVCASFFLEIAMFWRASNSAEWNQRVLYRADLLTTVVSLLVITCCVVLIKWRLAATSGLHSSNDVKVPYLTRPWSHEIGPRDAPVRIVEFADFQCPICRLEQPSIEKILLRYQGKVSLTYRQFPITSIHPFAYKLAEASECFSMQGDFWKSVPLLFAHQSSDGTDAIQEVAKAMSVKNTLFQRCLSGHRARAHIKQDVEDGMSLGVNATPTLFINGKEVVGLTSYQDLQKLIAKDLHLVQAN